MPEPIVTLNEESLKSDLRELVRGTVEDTLNGLLDEEAVSAILETELYDFPAFTMLVAQAAKSGRLLHTHISAPTRYFPRGEELEECIPFFAALKAAEAELG